MEIGTSKKEDSSEIVAYKRKVQRRDDGGIISHPGEDADCIFIPVEDVLLLRAWYTESKIMYYTLMEDPEGGTYLYEARKIAKGEHVEGPGLTISDIRKDRYETERLLQLIELARAKRKLESEVKEGIEELLK